MTIHDVDQTRIRTALELAGRAPSIHNSQPWRWVVRPHGVDLHADLRRQLASTDADARDLVISCGAALHHLRVALGAAGVAATVHRLPDPEQRDHLAAVELHDDPTTTTDLGLAAAITNRRTDRRRFSDWETPPALIDELIGRAADQGAVLRAVTEARARRQLLDAIAEAAHTQESTPAYAQETAQWSGRQSPVEGIPPANLLRDPTGTGGGLARIFPPGLLEQPDSSTPDGALLLVLGTASDDRLSQLRAGEALSAVILHATEFGLATCPMSQPLEVGRTRTTLRDDVLDGTLSPQLVLRVGWAPPTAQLPPTPRHPLADTAETRPY